MNLRFLSTKRHKVSTSYLTSIFRWFLYTALPSAIPQQLLNYSKIVSGSMTPTILTHDIVVLSKYSLTALDIIDMFTVILFQVLGGYAKLLQKFPFLSYEIIKFRNIEVGDVVSFFMPGDEATYSKRIIAGPNDTVQIYYGYVYINGKQLAYKPEGTIELEENDQKIYGQVFRETNGNKSYSVLYINGIGRQEDTTNIFYVPKDHYFVMGDNRHNSADGRSSLGFVHKQHITHQVIFNIFSNSNFTTLHLESWIRGIRRKYSFRFI